MKIEFPVEFLIITGNVNNIIATIIFLSSQDANAQIFVESKTLSIIRLLQRTRIISNIIYFSQRNASYQV